MAKRDHVARALGCHDAREPGHAQHIALLGRPFRYRPVNCFVDHDPAAGHGGALGDGLVAHIHHDCPALRIKMIERSARFLFHAIPSHQKETKLRCRLRIIQIKLPHVWQAARCETLRKDGRHVVSRHGLCPAAPEGKCRTGAMRTAFRQQEINPLHLGSHLLQGFPFPGLLHEDPAGRRNHCHAPGPGSLETPAVLPFLIQLEAMGIAFHHTHAQALNLKTRQQPFDEGGLARARSRGHDGNDRHPSRFIGDAPPGQTQVRGRIHIEERILIPYLDLSMERLGDESAKTPLALRKRCLACPGE